LKIRCGAGPIQRICMTDFGWIAKAAELVNPGSQCPMIQFRRGIPAFHQAIRL
jgi:hypothetical protein